MRFNICVSGLKNTFIEVAHALKLSLEEIGHTVDKITFGKKPTPYVPNEAVIVIMGKGDFLPLSKDSINILFFMEQWQHNILGKVPDPVKIRSQFKYIFDIFRENNKKYPDGSILCPLGWSEAFETNLSVPVNKNFFLFGSQNPTFRKQWLSINQRHILYSNRSFGKDRDRKILSAKINLMLKAEKNWLLPPLHMMLIVCKKKFLMMDPHKDFYPYEPNKHFGVFNDFPKDCQYWINNNKEREEFALKAYEDIKTNHKFTDYLYSALEEVK